MGDPVFPAASTVMQAARPRPGAASGPAPVTTGARPRGPKAGAEVASVTAMREAARAFEAAFLAEMLKHSGLGETPDAFGGGVGEQQFASLMREAQARHMAEAGGIGLAEHIFGSLLAREVADGDGQG